MTRRQRRLRAQIDWYAHQLPAPVRYGIAAAVGAALASPFWIGLVPVLAGCGR